MTASIYIATKHAGTKHTYWVYDPDGNPYSGDEEIIRGGLPADPNGLEYVIEVGRPIADSRDALNGDDPFADRYYTTVFDGTLLDIEAIWEEMKDAALSFGSTISDPDFSGEDAVLLAEAQYWIPAPDCHTLTATIASAVGVDILSNLPKVGGDTGSGVRTPAVYYPGIEARLESTGDDAITVSNALRAYFDQGGEDNYTLDVSTLAPSGTVRIFEDSDTGTVDRITLENVDPADVSILRTTHGDLLIYVAGRDIPILVVDGQFDGSGVPKINTVWVEPSVGSPVSVPVINQDDIPVYAPVPLPDLIPGEIQPAFASAINAASPLVIDLSSSHTGVTLTEWDADTTTSFFDLEDSGFAVQTAWVSGDTGLLARDLNSNGLIDSSAELFGSPTIDGFAKLAVLDSNHDLRIDNNDDDWSTLVVWTDTNGDAVTQSGELQSLTSLNIASIDLAGVVASTSTISGNPISHVSTVRFTSGATAAIADAWFVHDNTNSYYADDYTLDVETLFLPTLRGYGTLPDLAIAMSLDSDLKNLVADFVSNFDLADLADANDAIEDILFKWAGVEGVGLASRGYYIDARHLEFLERFVGAEFLQRYFLPDPAPQAAAFLEDAYHAAFNMLSSNLLIQAGVGQLFDVPPAYNPASGTITGDLSLSHDAISDLAAIAPSTDPENEAFWVALAEALDNIKGIGNLTVDEVDWLDTAVIASNALLDWADVLVAFYHDSGTSSLSGTSGADTLTGGNAHDTIHGNGGNDTVSGGYGNDVLYGDNDNDTLYGGAGNDTLRGGSGNDVLYGEDGNDILYGESGSDTYYGGAGGNLIESQNGADMFYYGGGEDVINDTGGTDQIVLSSGIVLADLTFTRVSTPNTVNTYNDLLITIAGSGSIQIQRFYTTSGAGAGVIESILFSDTSTLNLTTLANPVVHLTSGNDSFSSSATGDWTVYGGDGDDYIYNYQSGAHTFDGGNGNDTLRGGSGNDTYIASTGFDIIQENNGTDTIVVPAGFTIDDVTFYRILGTSGPTSDLGISITGLGQINVQGQFSSAWVEYLHFDEDNTTITLAAMSIATVGTAGNDNLYPPSAHAGADDLMDGREGDDYLAGGAGNDTYVFSAGNDKVYDTGGNDTIRVRDIYTPSDVTIAWNYNSVNINDVRGFILTDTDGNTLIAQNQSYNASNVIEHVAFANGTVWDLNSIELTLSGTASNDTIQGRDIGDASSNDTIYGLGGNDSINGGNGADLIYGGDGNDTIYGNSGADTIYGGDGTDAITANSNDGNDTIYGDAGNDTLKGADHSVLYGGDGDDILMNIATSPYAATTQVTMYGGAGADTLSGLYGESIMNGGAGADTLQGYVTGRDTFAFDAATAFDAVDTITNFQKTGVNADKIDIADVLDGYFDPLTELITDFVQFTTNGSNSEVYVDTTGSATFGAAQHIATIQSVTGLTDEAALVTAGLLIAA